ncbi:hypothetical protein AVEN_245563-1 [Araneus ventricosus]|uniref:Uncharacterized protein n=1 Tax=Araneus ventricosus TaxID=182803 RepID=A0A4Y2FQP9_ARAVE|nr:hypothetical protein AVEN_245563-1 [Araneus ventricosus]
MFSVRTNRHETENGIFIRSTKSYNVIIETFKDLIQNSMPDGKITLEIISEKYGGVEIYLNRDDVVQELLGKRFLLNETGDVLFTIHPLTTQLIIRGAVFSIEEYDFIGKLMVIIHDTLGPVLEICKIPSSEPQLDIWYCNWGVLLDVPDIEDLDDFKRVGLPDDFKITVPGVYGMLSVNFYCARCEKDGHTRWRCFESIGIKTKSVSKYSQEKHLTIESPCTPFSRFSIPNHEEENKERDITSKISPLTKSKNNREFRSRIENEPIYRNILQERVSSNSHKTSFYSSNSTMKRLLFPERDYPNSESQPKRACISPMNDDHGQSDNSSETSSVTNKTACRGLFPVTFFSNSDESSSSSTMKRLLFPEEDGPNSESKSKKVRISPVNDDHGQSDNTSENISTTDESRDKDIFEEFNFPYYNTDEFSSSSNDSAMKRSLFPERDDPTNESHSKTACIPSMNDDRGHWNNTSETNNTTNNSLNRDIFSNIFSSNTGKSSYFNNDFARQSSLSPESDYPKSKSHSKSVCVSPMNDDNGQWNNTSERSHITNKHVYRNIFSKINYSKSGEFSYSNNDFTRNCSLFPERDYPNSESHSQNSGISTMNDNQGQWDIKSETKSATNDADSETIIVYDPVPSTSSKNQSQHVRRLDGSANGKLIFI